MKNSLATESYVLNVKSVGGGECLPLAILLLILLTFAVLSCFTGQADPVIPMSSNVHSRPPLGAHVVI